MTERPIIFSAPMVRAILDGRKTQTRRAVKVAPENWCPVKPRVFAPTKVDRHGEEYPGPDAFGAGTDEGDGWIVCPYGRPGDLLWVRETHAELLSETGEPIGWVYRADGEVQEHLLGGGRWRPSIHMPRWASRITLEITGVRVERLQDISEADAIAEGVQRARGDWWSAFKGSASPSIRGAYGLLWESIHGPGSWAANPWVWVIEFRRLKP